MFRYLLFMIKYFALILILGSYGQTDSFRDRTGLTQAELGLIVGFSIAGGTVGIVLLVLLPICILYIANKLCCPHVKLNWTNSSASPGGFAVPPGPSCGVGGCH